jgi:hypothetical protein
MGTPGVGGLWNDLSISNIELKDFLTIAAGGVA